MRIFDLCVAKKLSGGRSQINPQDFVVVFEQTSTTESSACHLLSNPEHDLTWRELFNLFLNFPVAFRWHVNISGSIEQTKTILVNVTGAESAPRHSFLVIIPNAGSLETFVLQDELDNLAKVALP